MVDNLSRWSRGREWVFILLPQHGPDYIAGIRTPAFLSKFTRSMWRTMLVLTGLMSWCAVVCSSTASVRAANRFDGLDAYVEAAMEKWAVPGLAIAVVRDDE